MESYSSLICSKPSSTGRLDISDPVSIYYELYGQADGRPKVLVLGGALCKIGFMAFIIKALLDQGYEVLTYDTRGLGNSTTDSWPQTTRMLAEDCLAVVDHVWGEASHFNYLGLSMGGMVGQELAALLVCTGRAKRLLAMYLLATGPGTYMRPPPFLRRALVWHGMLKGKLYPSTDSLLSHIDQHLLTFMFSKSWLDAPIPTEGAQKGIPHAAGSAGVTAHAAASSSSSAGVATRRQALHVLLREHWRRMLAAHSEDAHGVTGQLTALLSHYLSPARAEAIKQAGVRITVGFTPHDALFPAPQQRALVDMLGARLHKLQGTPGHCDCLFLDSVQGVLLPGVLQAFERSSSS